MSKITLYAFIVLAISCITNVLLAEQPKTSYRCTVVWLAGTYFGKGETVKQAVDSARENCRNSGKAAGSRACTGAPQNIECIDQDGRCVTSSEFLSLGLSGGSGCKTE